MMTISQLTQNNHKITLNYTCVPNNIHFFMTRLFYFIEKIIQLINVGNTILMHGLLYLYYYSTRCKNNRYIMCKNTFFNYHIIYYVGPVQYNKYY